MSQHYFDTIHQGESTTVLMGWDRPMQGFFMVIEKASDVDEPFWSNLSHHNPPHPRALDSFISVLKKLGIAIPPQMINEIIEDQKNNIGNKSVSHYL